jgi:hypothetical protein
LRRGLFSNWTDDVSTLHSLASEADKLLLHRVFLISLHRLLQLHVTEKQRPPVYPVTTSVFRTAIKETG